MKEETRILLTALRNFLDRPEVKDKVLTAVMPVDAKLGNLSGKEVDVPFSSVFQGITNKLSFSDMARSLDDNNDVVIIFLDELSRELKDYMPPIEKQSVPIKDRDEAVKSLSRNLKVDDMADINVGDDNEDEKSEKQ